MKPKNRIIHITDPRQLKQPAIKKLIHQLLYYYRDNLKKTLDLKPDQKIRLKNIETNTHKIYTFSFGVRLAQSKHHPEKYKLSIQSDTDHNAYSTHSTYQLRTHREPAHQFTQAQLKFFWKQLSRNQARASKWHKKNKLYLEQENLTIDRHHYGNEKVLCIKDKATQQTDTYLYNAREFIATDIGDIKKKQDTTKASPINMRP